MLYPQFCHRRTTTNWADQSLPVQCYLLTSLHPHTPVRSKVPIPRGTKASLDMATRLVQIPVPVPTTTNSTTYNTNTNNNNNNNSNNLMGPKHPMGCENQRLARWRALQRASFAVRASASQPRVDARSGLPRDKKCNSVHSAWSKGTSIRMNMPVHISMGVRKNDGDLDLGANCHDTQSLPFAAHWVICFGQHVLKNPVPSLIQPPSAVANLATASPDEELPQMRRRRLWVALTAAMLHTGNILVRKHLPGKSARLPTIVHRCHARATKKRGIR